MRFARWILFWPLLCIVASCGEKTALGGFTSTEHAEKQAERLIRAGIECSVVAQRGGGHSGFALEIVDGTRVPAARDLISRLLGAERSASLALPPDTGGVLANPGGRTSPRDAERILCTKLAALHPDVVAVVVALPLLDEPGRGGLAGFVGTPKPAVTPRRGADVTLHLFRVVGRPTPVGSSGPGPTSRPDSAPDTLEAAARSMISVCCGGLSDGQITLRTSWIEATWCGAGTTTDPSIPGPPAAARESAGESSSIPLPRRWLHAKPWLLVAFVTAATLAFAACVLVGMRLRRRRAAPA